MSLALRNWLSPTSTLRYHDSYRQWLSDDCHGDMAYMADNLDKRLYPERLLKAPVAS